MSAPNSPHLDCPNSTAKARQHANRTAPHPAVVRPKGDAEGVRKALRPDPRSHDGRYAVAWLHIRAPHGATPTATSTCACGRDRSAVGRTKVLALIADHTAHRDTCPLRNPQEGRNAA
ncbi:hypothetical protein [Streptomyces sp. ISL-11]|uniref:hypothetical protein n=1 Tax=Streptomyces sp. ISL-11 TaxID=2819174 RepID=UPI00203554D6|nr:hypothetical protein [Streptomyces sp. ISL-11]